MLTDNIKDYEYQSQGKTTIPGVDDAEECLLTDVSVPYPHILPSISHLYLTAKHDLLPTVNGNFLFTLLNVVIHYIGDSSLFYAGE